jgi:hypothetical protein
MAHLAWVFRLSGPTHGWPHVPFLRVHDMWHSWYQISSGAARYVSLDHHHAQIEFMDGHLQIFVPPVCWLSMVLTCTCIYMSITY